MMNCFGLCSNPPTPTLINQKEKAVAILKKKKKTKTNRLHWLFHDVGICAYGTKCFLPDLMSINNFPWGDCLISMFSFFNICANTHSYKFIQIYTNWFLLVVYTFSYIPEKYIRKITCQILGEISCHQGPKSARGKAMVFFGCKNHHGQTVRHVSLL